MHSIIIIYDLNIIVCTLHIIASGLTQVGQSQICHLSAPRGHQPEHIPVARHDGGDAVSGHAPTEGGPQHVTGARVEADTVIGIGLCTEKVLESGNGQGLIFTDEGRGQSGCVKFSGYEAVSQSLADTSLTVEVR